MLFEGDETHGRALHDFRDCLAISAVVFVSFEKRPHIFCGDQADIMTKRSRLPPNMMGSGTGFHAAAGCHVG